MSDPKLGDLSSMMDHLWGVISEQVVQEFHDEADRHCARAVFMLGMLEGVTALKMLHDAMSRDGASFDTQVRAAKCFVAEMSFHAKRKALEAAADAEKVVRDAENRPAAG